MDNLRKLVTLPTVSGFEYVGAKVVSDILKESGAEVSIDKLSNVLAIKNKDKNFKVLLDAHFDTIGLMVTEIKEGGFLKFTTVGGVDPRILPSLSVTVHGNVDVSGVIGVKPPHLLSGKEDKAYKTEELFIDTGMEKDELLKIISCGDIVTFNSCYEELLNGKIAASGLDDKAGVFIVSQVFKKVKNENISLYGGITVGEEIGLKGAKALGSVNDFDLCIIIDVTHGLTPDSKKEESFELGKGPVITFSPSLSKKYNDMLKECAKKNNIEISIEVEGGNTGTNAWAYHSARYANPSVMVSVPLKYMHTSYEVIDKKDVCSAIELIVKFLDSLEVEKNA